MLLDNPGSFGENQTPKEALSIKHPTFSGQPVLLYQATLYYDFLQKPSQWWRAIQTYIKHEKQYVGFDVVSNDWYAENKDADLSVAPKKDSLKSCSNISRRVFLKEIAGKTETDVVSTKEPLINDAFKKQLRHIREIFDRQGTDYRIVVSPGFCYNSPTLNIADKHVLDEIFGGENVFDYTGYNPLTSDYNNYSDPNHFSLFVGWQIIEEIYGERE